MLKNICLAKKITLILGILMILLGLLPISGLSRIGSVYADDAQPPAGGEGDEVCGVEGCEKLPAMGEDPVAGTFKAEQVIPGTNLGSGYSGMTGDLTVEGETFDNIPAVCGDVDTRIYLGQNTPFQVCSVIDTDCINALRAAQSAAAFTPEQADQYGRTLDTIYEQSVANNNYLPVIGAFRWMTGDVSGADPFVGYLPSESIRTWIGKPENAANQPLAFWLGQYCYDDCPEAQTCPQHCGYEGGSVPDGHCSTLLCDAVPVPAAQECPTHCGYAGGTVPDGNCGTIECSAVPIPEAQECPSYCGYEGGTVPDGQCGLTECPAVQSPPAGKCPNYCGYPGGDKVSDGECGTRTCPAINCGGGGGFVPVTSIVEDPITPATNVEEDLIIPVTGVDTLGNLQFISLNSGLALIGVRCLLEGFNRRKRK